MPALVPPRPVLLWIFFLYALVGLVVVVGGITRLTGSGLSMVVWEPIMGIVPPLSAAEWERVFDQYKASPQYLQVNRGMGLGDFQWIFFWEYLHRVLARSVGIACLVPGLWFWARGSLRGRWARRAAAAFALGGAQGALGWFMVKSGLSDVPAVSHFRLAAHLSLAFFVGMWLLWLALDVSRPDLAGAKATRWSRRAWWLVGLLALQVVYGAFMAGTRAGYLFATFPDMHGQWIAPGAFALDSWWRNLLENPAMIHTIHRWLGWLVTGALLGFAFAASRDRSCGAAVRSRSVLGLLAALAVVQFAAGALTVVWSVYLPVAVVHQVLAYLLLSSAVFAAHRLREPPALERSPGGGR